MLTVGLDLNQQTEYSHTARLPHW